MATWYEKENFVLRKFAKYEIANSGFLLTRHKKPGKCGILGGAKRAGFSLRTDLSERVQKPDSYYCKREKFCCRHPYNDV